MPVNKKKNKEAFTLIEALVFLFIFSVTVLTFYKTMAIGTAAIIDAKCRLGAVALANERLEIIKNLSYDKIGTQGGVPSGDIPHEQQLVRSGVTYSVQTSIVYVDDGTDGIAVASGGSDSRPDDYKRVAVKVFWGDVSANKEAELAAFFAPPGMEEVYTGGILSVRIVDDTLIKGISGLDVHIVNNNVSPAIDTTETTDEDGKVFLLNYPISDKYYIEVSKTGYYAIMTYDSTVNMIARELPASVVAGAINARTMITDKYATINLHTQDPLGQAIANVVFDLKGGKAIGDTTVIPSEPIYDFNQTSQNSGGSGEKSFSNRSFGSYTFAFKDPAADYEFMKIAEATVVPDKFDVAPDGEADIHAILANKNTNSLWVTVADGGDGTLLAGATVELKNSVLNYGPITLTTDAFGQVYFPDASGALAADSHYEIKVVKDGYADFTKSNISIDKLTKESVNLSN